MTPERQAQQARIAAARVELEASLREHDHSASEAGCVVCSTVLTHSCPSSPDGFCHYTTVRGTSNVVLLRDGDHAVLPEPVEPESQTDDSCLFCGEPDERN